MTNRGEDHSYANHQNEGGSFWDQRSLISSCDGCSLPAGGLSSPGVPIGRKTLKQVPPPRRDRKRRLPRCFVTRLLASHSPSPVPLSSLVVKNGSSTRLRSSLGMPGP